MSVQRIMAVAAAIAVSTYVIAPVASAQQPTYATHSDPVLAALIDESLERNPRVRAAFLEARAAESRTAQSTALPDPSLSFTQHVVGPQTRVGPQLSSVAVTQSLPWFGTLSDRRAAASAASAMQGESYHEQQAEVVLQVKLAYFNLAYLDEALGITEEEEQLLLHYETLARARYSQGFGQQQEVVKLQAEVTRALNRRLELLRQRTEFESSLNVLADRPVDTPVPTVTIMERPVIVLDDERLRTTGMDERPEVRSARLQVERDEHGVSLARRRYRPDLAVGVAWGSVLGRRDDLGRANPPPDDGRDTWSLTLGASVPVFRGSYDAGVSEAAARLSASEEAFRDAVNSVALAVRSTAFRLTTIEGQLALFERSLLPQVEQALRATEEAYSGGVTGVLELLDSEEMLLDVRLGHARLQADYMKALAEMERAIGSAFPEEEGS